MTKTIHELRRQGFKVAVQHIPFTKSTHIILTTPEGKHTEGFSSTHVNDQYNRKIGNAVALGRALKNLERGIYCELPASLTTPTN